jgi:hypothetical protein
VDSGFEVAVTFFMLSILVLFFSSVLLGLVDFLRRFIG